MLSITLITAVYSLILFFTKLGIFVAFVASTGLMCVICLNYLIHITVQLAQTSQGFSESSYSGIGTPWFTKYDVLFLKSCLPIRIRLGNWFYISSRSFALQLFGNNIILAIIQLLVILR